MASKWHNLSPSLGIFCISVCCEIFDVDPSHIEFWIMLLISLITFARANLLSTVMFSFRDNFLSFHMFKVDLVEIMFIESFVNIKFNMYLCIFIATVMTI